MGRRAPKQKLTAEQVLEIRNALATGCTQSELARRYGVARSTIHEIRHGRAWVRLLKS